MANIKESRLGPNTQHSQSSVMTKPGVFVVNLANPKAGRLASRLSEHGHLRTFVRRYANMGCPWEKFIEKLLVVNRRHAGTMGRRTLLPALRNSDVVNAGVPYDFLAAIARRSSGHIGPRASEIFLRLRRRSIARAARSTAGDATLVVGNYGVSLEVFERIARKGGRATLNYRMFIIVFNTAFSRKRRSESKE